jgi:hypothetical protein
MEHLITISLAEYNEIKDIKHNFQKAFDEKKTILFHDSYFPGHSGYPVHKFTIVNTDTFIDDLRNKISELQKENSKISNELYELKEKERKRKKWWF